MFHIIMYVAAIVMGIVNSAFAFGPKGLSIFCAAWMLLLAMKRYDRD